MRQHVGQHCGKQCQTISTIWAHQHSVGPLHFALEVGVMDITWQRLRFITCDSSREYDNRREGEVGLAQEPGCHQVLVAVAALKKYEGCDTMQLYLLLAVCVVYLNRMMIRISMH